MGRRREPEALYTLRWLLFIIICSVLFWALLLIFALSPRVSHAGTLRLRWTWPCFVDSVGCAIMDSTAEARVLETLGPPADSVFIPDSSWFLTNLDHGTVWGVRCSSINDTLRIGDIDATGKECTADSVDLDIQDGSVGWVWITATDHDGDTSCAGSWVTFAFPATGAPPPGPGLTASLYMGTDLAGEPVGTRTDSTVNYSWGNGPGWPGGPVDGFSIRWDGWVTLPEAGTWRFYVSSDDGRRLFIDGVSVIDFWVPTWSEGTWAGTLSAGRHRLRLDYFEGSGGALVSLSWAGPDGVRQVVPASALSH